MTLLDIYILRESWREMYKSYTVLNADVPNWCSKLLHSAESF